MMETHLALTGFRTVTVIPSNAEESRLKAGKAFAEDERDLSATPRTRRFMASVEMTLLEVVV